MPSARKCIIPDCKSNSITTKLCKFPASSYIASLWKEILKGTFPSLKLVIADNGRCQQYICHLHFEAKYIKEGGKRVYHAIPTLFTENEISSGTPSQAFSMVKNPEHKDLVSKIRTRPFTSGDKHNTVHHDHNYGQIQQMKLLLPNPPSQHKDTSSLHMIESETQEDQDTSFLYDEDASDTLHDQYVPPKAPVIDAFGTLHDQNVPPKAPVIDAFGTLHDQTVPPKAPVIDAFDTLHDQNVPPKAPVIDAFGTYHDQNVPPKAPVIDAFDTLHDQNVPPKAPVIDAFGTLHDQNVPPKAPVIDAFDTLHDQNVPPNAPVIANKTQMDQDFNDTTSLPSYYYRKQTEYFDKYDRFALMIAAKIREIVDSFDREALIISIKKLVYQTIDTINTRIRTSSNSDTSKMTDFSNEHAIYNTPNQTETSPVSVPLHNPVKSWESETAEKPAWTSASKTKLKPVTSRATDPVHNSVISPETEHLTDPVTSLTFSAVNTPAALRPSEFPQKAVESHDRVTSGASETVHNPVMSHASEPPTNPVTSCASSSKRLALRTSKSPHKPVTSRASQLKHKLRSRISHSPQKTVTSRVLRAAAARSAMTEFS